MDIFDFADSLMNAMADRRTDMRFLTVYRIVKVEHAGDEGLGCCRNISDGGAKLELHMDLYLGDKVTVAFSSEHLLCGKVVWARGNDYGIAFDKPVDCMALLGGTAMPSRSASPRAPRLNTSLPARISYDGGTCCSVVSDISVRGMKIASGFEPGLRVRVILDGGRECEGIVQWTQDNVAGVLLLEPFRIEDLGSVQRLCRTRLN
jgi:hypothetical protein